MMSDFEPWSDAKNNNAGAQESNDNPLAVFGSAEGDRGVDGGGTVDLLGPGGGGTVDLLGPGDADPFGQAGGKLEECDLIGDRKNDEGIEEEEDEYGAAGGENLLDMEGWNLRRRGGEAQGDEDAGKYGVDDKTPNMEVNASGERNNGRRGLFSRWGSQRHNNDSAAAPALQAFGGGGGGPSEDTYSKVPRDGIEEATLAYGEGGITGDVDVHEDDDAKELEDEQKTDNRLRPGDHVYVWQTYGINPRAYQRHAVVFTVTLRGDVDPATLPPPEVLPTGEEEPLSFDVDSLYDDDIDEGVEVTVVSFYHLQRQHQTYGAAQASGKRREKRSGSKREHLVDFMGPDALVRKKPIHKVRYGRKVKKGILSQKAGVGTALKKDRAGLILARVQYVLDRPDHLPSHNALSANGECASLWCVTGRWCTLQGASILAITSAGGAGSALLAGGILSNLTMLVPMPGVWGMAGWWWYVPATVAYPFLVPMLVALGMASLVPLEILRRNRKKWRVITDGINHDFWTNASDGIKEEYFGQMATAEREAEMRTFFGVREGEAGPGSTGDSKYMPLGATQGVDEEEDADEALAMQQMEKSCQNMAADMNVDLSGRPQSERSPRGGGGKAWGSFFRRSETAADSARDDERMETEKFRSASNFT